MFTVFLVWGYFLTFNSSTDTNSGVHQNACCLGSIITPFYLQFIVLALSPAVTNLPNKTLIFHDSQGPTIKFFPGQENKILKFHDFPGFPWPVRTLKNISTEAFDSISIDSLSPNIHLQILQTDLHTFPLRISWENLIKDQGIFSLVIILLISTTLSLDNVWILWGKNLCWSLLGLKTLT